MGQWLFNMAWAVDAFVSTILGGEPDDTLSERVGRAYLARSALSLRHRLLITAGNNFINWLAWIVTGGKQHDHCADSLRGKTNCKEIWNWGGYRKPKLM